MYIVGCLMFSARKCDNYTNQVFNLDLDMPYILV